MQPKTELVVARESWARQIWERSKVCDRTDERLEYLTQSLGWLVDRTQEIAQIGIADRFDQLDARLDAAIAPNPPNPDSSTSDDLPLYSDLGIDYTPLALALSQADWRTADAITDDLIRMAIALNSSPQTAQTSQFCSANPNPNPNPNPRPNTNTILNDIARFPTTDLQTIAWAWAAYSEGRLGLVAQASQWTGDYATFCDRVGWRNARGWSYYGELRFEPETLDALPIGHFPVLGWRKRACYGIGGETASEIMLAWFDRWQQIAAQDGTE